jgi:hypothetical protein
MSGSFRQLCLVVALARAAAAGDLYWTDFEDFSVGPNQWAGTGGWLGNSATTGSHGISQGLVPGLGKTAYLGLNRPSAPFVSVYRPLAHDPVAEGTAALEFETLMGIEDSTNGRHDDFYFSFYNIAGQFLGAILLSNNPLTYGIWRLDGNGVFDTGIDFTHGELHLLNARIDPHANTWSAEFDGLPLFTGATFNATGRPRTFGPVAAEWQLDAALPENHGDNWLLVADWRVTAVPPGTETFNVEEFSISESGQPVLGWTGEPGWTYRVTWSDDLVEWLDDLPGSSFIVTGKAAPLQFTDPTPRGSGARYYRIERSVTP